MTSFQHTAKQFTSNHNNLVKLVHNKLPTTKICQYSDPDVTIICLKCSHNSDSFDHHLQCPAQEEWRDELTITDEYIKTNEVYKLIKNEKLIGYYSFFKNTGTKVKLENLFIDPQFMNCGYGKLLLLNFIKRARELEYEEIMLKSDPNAEKFYVKFGFEIVGLKESSINNRYLPIMEKKIKPAHNNMQ